MLTRVRRPRGVRLAAVAACVALAAAGCSSGGDDSGSASPSPSPSQPSSTVSVPSGSTLTAQGSGLSFGDTATVVYEPEKGTGTVLDLTVHSARQGSMSDFKNFILDDPYKKNANYYYVKVTVTNVGEGDVGGNPVPLWGVNGENTLLPAVTFTTAFAPCPSEKLPKEFGSGATLDTCLVYLSPDHGTLEKISYRPSQEFNPISWTGTVAPPAKTAKGKQSEKGTKKS